MDSVPRLAVDHAPLLAWRPSLRGVSRVFRSVSNVANHYYSQDRAGIDEQVAQGGILEGLGPKGLVYCAQ